LLPVALAVTSCDREAGMEVGMTGQRTSQQGALVDDDLDAGAGADGSDAIDGGDLFDGGSLPSADARVGDGAVTGEGDGEVGDGEEAPDAIAAGDRAIAGVLLAVHAVAREQGALALTKAEAVDVAAFGATLESEHIAADRALLELLAALEVAATQSTLSRSVASDGNAALESLRVLAGPEFDAQYLLAQIAQHQRTLASIDAGWLPAIEHEAFRVHVLSVREALVAQLDEAQRLLASLAEQ
jgi:predicted outer membrane protein